jgi:hypothetical protein
MVALQNGSVVTVRDLVSGNCTDGPTGLPIQFKLAENGLSGTASINDETDPKNKRVRGYTFDLSLCQVPVTVTDQELPEAKAEATKPAPAPAPAAKK